MPRFVKHQPPESAVISSENKVEVYAIVETPQGSQNKYTYDPATGTFSLGTVLAAGATFPFEFGFIPATIGGDGDPLDLLILMDAPTFPGCRVCARVIGVLEVNQRGPKEKTHRNDRLVAVAVNSHRHRNVRKLSDLSTTLLDEIEHFFIAYNEMKETSFIVLARRGPKTALRLIVEAMERARD